MNNPTWRNHYVPEFYQRQWTSPPDGKLWCSTRELSGKISVKRRSPTETGFAVHLYTERAVVPGLAPHRPDAIEHDVFGPIDNDAARMFPRLLAHEKLTDEEQESWARFLNSLLERAPHSIEPITFAARERAVKLFDEMRARSHSPEDRASLEEVLNVMSVDALASNAALERMSTHASNEQIVDGLAKCERRIVEIGSTVPIELITSDTPLVVNGGRDDSDIGVLSIALAPRKLFILAVPGFESILQDMDLIRAAVITHFGVVLRHARFAYSLSKPTDGKFLQTRTAIEKLLQPRSGNAATDME